MSLIFNSQLQFVEMSDFDSRLFFGKQAEKLIGHSLWELALAIDGRNKLQIESILDNILRAQRERRNVYLEYISSFSDRETASVVAHVIVTDETICLQATEVHADDLRCAREVKDVASVDVNAPVILQTIFENLPVGIEVYDRSGKLIELNPAEMQIMGVLHRDDVLGLDFYENPNISDDVKVCMREGKDVRFTVEYDFKKANDEYFLTTQKENRYFDVSISVIRDTRGAVDKYLLISRDFTEEMLLRKKYENLYAQTLTILNSLPVGVELYANDGTILYFNDMDCRIFGVPDKDFILNQKLSIYDNPNLPDKVKNAVRDGVKVHTHFPYNFDLAEEKAYITSMRTDRIRQIECNGTPIINASGEVDNYVFIVEDATESIQVEEMLRQNKQKTELAMQAADIMLWEFNTQTGLFTSENDPLNGYDKMRLLTIQDYTESLHPDDMNKGKVMIQGMGDGREESFSFDARVKFPEIQEWQYCTISGTPYERGKNGEIIKYVGFRKNNTEQVKRKLLQEEILNNIPLPIHIKDVADDFRYVFCNEESKQMFGICEKKTTYDVMEAYQVERIQKNDLEVFETGNPYFGKEWIILKDGRSYDTIVSKSIIYADGKNLLLTIRWDQSLQNELKRRAKVLSISLDALHAYTWFYDPQTDQLSYGEGFEKNGQNALGVNTLEKYASYIHPDDREMFLDKMEQVLKQDNGDFVLDYRIDFKDDGNYEWWECRGILETSMQNEILYKCMFGMDINIDVHKNTELMLLKNKENLNRLIRQNELVLNNTNSGLAYITSDYIVQWENVSICSASLSTEAYKRGELCYASAHNRTTPCQDCVMQRAMKSRQMEQTKFCLSSRRTMEVFATPVINDEDEVEGIVIRLDDVTDREAMIAELRQAKLQAEQSDKLKSAFLANMSHEIRTPLNAIVGFSELLMSTDELEQREEYARIINTNNELLLKLINDILDLSKIEAGSVELKYEDFDLSEYFNGLVFSMKQRITNPNVRLIAVNPYASCLVKLDKNRVAQIMTNYVTNAIKYTPKGYIEMGYERVDGGMRIYVKDSGIGIQDEKKSRVFHRFEKLDEFAQGTGLGLSICKAIAESMNGNVGFKSNYGEGSLFWAFLPCVAEVRTKQTMEENVESTLICNESPESKDKNDLGASTRKIVLVAEDIPSNYLLVSALLHKDYELLHAVNGKEAIEMAKEHHVDVVLMDMKMPIMDGLLATAEIRKFDARIPIVALTAHAFDSDRAAALEAGCNEYLVKPIARDKLMAVLQKYC